MSATATLTVGSGGGGSGSVSVTVTPGPTSQKGHNYQTPITVDSSASNFSVTLSIYSGSSCSGSPVASGNSSTTGSSVTFNFNTKSTGTYCARADVTAGSSNGTDSATFDVT